MKRTPLNRKTPLSKVSKKRKSILGKRKTTREIVLSRANGICEARLDECDYEATDVHEILTRARGGSIIDPDNCLALCRSCHRFITENPRWSNENGWTVSAYVDEAGLIAARRARLLRAWEDES